jgi:excisionase family DNA binding protein
MTERLAYRVPEVCAMLGISRATLYRRVKTGEIAIHKLGSISFVKREGLEALLETLPGGQPTSVPTFRGEAGRNGQQQGETARDTKPLRVRKKVRRHETV